MGPLRYGWLMVALVLLGCGASRKLSQYGVRRPASVPSPVQPELRLKAAELKFAKTCPEKIRAEFPSLALAKIEFPVCPENLFSVVEQSRSSLRLEEKSVFEEILASRCRSLGSGAYGETLESIYENFGGTGPLGRTADKTSSADPEILRLRELQGLLQDLVEHHLPLDRWIRRNGDYLIPDEELQHLHRLLGEKNCRMSDDDLERTYRALRTLEDLSKILKDETQAAKMRTLVEGIQQVVDKRLVEFFYP
jgi:hypothetical protein